MIQDPIEIVQEYCPSWSIVVDLGQLADGGFLPNQPFIADPNDRSYDPETDADLEPSVTVFGHQVEVASVQNYVDINVWVEERFDCDVDDIEWEELVELLNRGFRIRCLVYITADEFTGSYFAGCLEITHPKIPDMEEILLEPNAVIWEARSDEYILPKGSDEDDHQLKIDFES